MNVLAKPGTRCPKEWPSKETIPDSGEPVSLPDTSYYRRLVKDGSLIQFGVGSSESGVKPETKAGSGKSKEVKTDGK